MLTFWKKIDISKLIRCYLPLYTALSWAYGEAGENTAKSLFEAPTEVIETGPAAG